MTPARGDEGDLMKSDNEDGMGSPGQDARGHSGKDMETQDSGEDNGETRKRDVERCGELMDATTEAAVRRAMKTLRRGTRMPLLNVIEQASRTTMDKE